MKELLIILAIFLPLILIYVASYFFNSKAEVPEGIEPVDKCSVCNSDTCAIRDVEEMINTVKCELDLEREAKENLDQ